MGDTEKERLAKMDVKLDHVLTDLEEIKSALYGDGNHDGLRLDVDRLKRSRATHNAVLWVIFTAIIGIVSTAVAGMIGN